MSASRYPTASDVWEESEHMAVSRTPAPADHGPTAHVRNRAAARPPSPPPPPRARAAAAASPPAPPPPPPSAPRGGCGGGGSGDPPVALPAASIPTSGF